MSIKDLKNMGKEEIFELLGITSESSVLRKAGLLAIGAVVGAAAALLLAPKTGADLRETLGQRARDAANSIASACCSTNKAGESPTEIA